VSQEVVVIANDVVPGMAGPVAAPGLRAWGIAAGLRAHGYRPLLVVDGGVARRAWRGLVPQPTPRDTLVLEPSQFGALVRSRRPEAVVMTNSNHIDSLDEIGDVPLIYDFFAPKVLELAQHADSEQRAREVAAVESRKLRGLAACRAVIVNGAKKLPYVRGWLERAGNPSAPTAVVNMPLSRTSPEAPDHGPLHVIVSGYIQPWSQPGPWAEAVLPLLREGKVVLHLLIANHWGGNGALRELPDMFRSLASVPGVRRHGLMEFRDFRKLLSRCHVNLDVFARNPERELAFVTRSAVALSCGVPVVHVPFTEVSELVREHDAGWLVEDQDVDGIHAVLRDAADRPELLHQKRAGAAAVAARLEPREAVAPLADLLEDLR
jgi:glycosyltransferase involved in cell wall biosynthesis